MGEVELARHGRVRLDAVDEDEDVVRLRAADTHLGQAGIGARPADADARQAAQRVGSVAHLLDAKFLLRDDGHRAALVLGRDRRAL